jgi:hypothetical protein
MRDHVIAIVAFLVCYVVGFQVALGGAINDTTFGWAMLFGVAFIVPSLFFVGSSYLLFFLIRWWTTVLLSVVAIGIYAYNSGLHSESWNMALAVVIATIVHQMILLVLRQGRQPVSR